MEGRDDLLGDGAPGGVAVLVVGGADLLGAPVGELDLDVLVSGGEGRVEAGALPVGQPVLAGAQDVPDLVQRIVRAAAVPGGVLSFRCPETRVSDVLESNPVSPTENGSRSLSSGAHFSHRPAIACRVSGNRVPTLLALTRAASWRQDLEGRRRVT